MSSPLSSRQKAYRKGVFSENLATLFLRLKGYRILAKRYKTPFGEIDLVVRKGQLIAAVEVKARPTVTLGLEALTARGQARMKRAFQYLLTQHAQYGCYTLRFDLIVIRPWRFPLHFLNVIQ